MPGQEWGKQRTPTHLHLFRSVSVRENCTYGFSSETRRSTSFDDTLGELPNASESLRADDSLEPIKKKASFWQNRVWKFAKGKKGAPQKDESTPKWKKLLYKLRSRAKDTCKPAICASGLDLQVANRDESGLIKGEGRSKALSNQAERQQRLYSVHPEPIAASQSSTTAPIWERRNVARPSTLDLSNLRVTGLKHLQRPH